MNPQLIRRLDSWLGTPICWLLTLVRRAAELVKSPRNPPPPKRMLFIKLVELGANVQAAAAVKRAVEAVGPENVYFWVFAENRPVLELLDLVPPENILAVRSKGLFALAADLIRTLIAVRRLRIDTAVDLEFFARASAILAYLSGAERRVGLHRFSSAGPYRGDLMTHRVQYNPYVHVSQYYRLLVEVVLGSADEVPLPKCPAPPAEQTQAAVPQFVPSASELRLVEELLRTTDQRRLSAPIVIINPNASDIVPLRKWPMDRFVELGRRLLATDSRLSIVITGAPEERSAAEELAAAIGSSRAISVAGRTTLRQLLTLYCLCDVLVTNDSGPAQLAAMTPIDTVVLFGPETPQLWRPLGGQRTHVLWAALACSPCVNALNFRFSACNRARCMEEISVDQVAEAALAALRLRGQRTLQPQPLAWQTDPRASQTDQCASHDTQRASPTERCASDSQQSATHDHQRASSAAA